MAISYTDFPKNLYFKCTMNLKLDHHTYKVNFSKRNLLVWLSSKNTFWMTRKKNPSHQKWWFLDFLLTNTRAFWLLHSYELALTEQSPLNLPKSRVHEASKNFPGPVDSNFEIKMLFLSLESKKLLNEVITSFGNGLKLRQNWCRLGKNLNFSMFEACMYK